MSGFAMILIFLLIFFLLIFIFYYIVLCFFVPSYMLYLSISVSSINNSIF